MEELIKEIRETEKHLNKLIGKLSYMDRTIEIDIEFNEPEYFKDKCFGNNINEMVHGYIFKINMIRKTEL